MNIISKNRLSFDNKLSQDNPRTPALVPSSSVLAIPNYKDFVETVDIYTTRKPTRVSRSEIASTSNKLLENDDFTYEPTEQIYVTTSPTCNSTYMTMPPTELSIVSTDNTNTHENNMYYATISVSGICFFIVFFYLYRLYYVNRYKIQKIQNIKHSTRVSYHYEYNSQF
jgi:hypothetical protein